MFNFYKPKKLSFIIITLFLTGLAGTTLAQDGDSIMRGGAPGITQPVEQPQSQGTFNIQHVTRGTNNNALATTTFTFNDLVVFASFDNTEITVYDGSNNVVANFTIDQDEYNTVSPGSGVYRVEGTKNFSLLTGDPITKSVVGFYSVNENGSPLSTKHNTYFPSDEWDGEYFIIFAYQDNTQYELKNLATGNIISAGILDEGEHYVHGQNNMFLGVTSNKPVSTLTYTDQGYHYPAKNGTFKGQTFYGFSGNVGGWTNGVIATAYEDSTNVTIKNTQTGTVIWSGMLNEGEVHDVDINSDTYVTVESDKDITVANTPYAGFNDSYYYLTRRIGNEGLGIAKKFYVPMIAGRMDVFSHADSNNVTLTNIGTNTQVWSGTLNEGEGNFFNLDYGRYKVESSKNSSVLTSNSGSWGADFMPLNYNTTLPDLSITSDDISFDPDSVTVGDSVEISAVVHNNSNIDVSSDVSVRFYDGDPYSGGQQIGQEQIIPQINGNSIGTASVDWITPQNPGVHYIYAVVDFNNNITESNESNNIANKPLENNGDLLPPLSITIDAPYGLVLEDGELVPNPFEVVATISNNAEVAASNVVATMNDLPTGLVFSDTSNPASQPVGELGPSESTEVQWTLVATEDSTGTLPYSMLFTADDIDDKLVERGINVPKISTQEISYVGDWNITSFAVDPEVDSLKKIFQPLIDAGHFVKAIDEQGNIIENMAWGWADNIGIMHNTEGYYLRLSSPNTLSVTGVETELPYGIPLEQYWNMSGYPALMEQNAMTVLDDLINAEVLLKVIDESGNIIQHFPFGWVNNIGTFRPGEGYYIKVSQEANLVINEPASNQGDLPEPYSAPVAEHFDKVYSGNPYQPMQVVINTGELDLQEGDELALFSDGVCVGAAGYKPSQTYQYLTASMDDPTTTSQDGFIEGTSVVLKVYRDQSNETHHLPYQIVEGEGGYSGLATLLVKANALTTGIGSPVSGDLVLYQNRPNPVNGKTEISYNLPRSGKVTLKVYDMHGQQQATLVRETQQEGMHTLALDGPQFRPGVYIYRLTFSNEVTGERKTKMRKMTIIK